MKNMVDLISHPNQPKPLTMLLGFMSTMILLIPSVTCQSFNGYPCGESCNPMYEPFANLHAGMVGYDILKGNPFDVTRLYDPGYRNFIFLPMIMNEQNRYFLHAGVTATGISSCQVAIRTDIITTVEGYQDKISQQTASKTTFTSNVEVDVEVEKNGASVKSTIPSVVDASFSSSNAYKENEGFFSKDKGVLVMSDSTCPSYSMEISSYDPPPFSPAFINALKELNETITKSESVKDDAVQRFLTSFGTHFMQQSIMGARIAVTSRFTEGEYGKLNENDVRDCNEQGVKVSVKASVGHTVSSCKGMGGITSNNVNNNLKRTYISSYGSKPKNDIIDWANQDFDEPVPIKMKLSPLLNLFQENYMKEAKLGVYINYQEILQLLAPRYWKYCETNKDELNIDTCKPSQQKGCGWNDNCIRGVQSCINRYHANGDIYPFCCNSPCARRPCKNGGTCVDEMDTCAYSCKCKASYGGPTCGERVVDKNILTNEVQVLMQQNIRRSNDDFRSMLQRKLASMYPRYDFTVSSYNEVSGAENHWYIGYGVIHVWRKYGRNVVVMYVRKGTGSNVKANVLRGKALDKISGRNNCDAKWSATTAMNKLKKLGGDVVNAVHVVRWGHGLRTSRSSSSSFDNFRCMRVCKKNWFTGKVNCEDHHSSIVIMFGKV